MYEYAHARMYKCRMCVDMNMYDLEWQNTNNRKKNRTTAPPTAQPENEVCK